MKKLLLLIKVLTLLILTINVNAQYQWCGFEDIPYDTVETRGTRKSSNGWHLPAHGELRVLVAFLEMVYTPSDLDPSPNGTNEWPVGQLPVWADSLFDHVTPSGVAYGIITRYFQDASSGNKVLLGDYLVSPDNGGVFQVPTTNGNANPSNLTSAINVKLENNIVTANGYNSITDFDKWTTTGRGLPKDQVGNNKWDNVVFIVRNSRNPGNGNGSASPDLNSNLIGYQGDAFSIQCTHGNIPTNIVRHEYAHFLLGGNNFHAGGGGWGTPNDYWIPTIGGWSMLGLHGCSFTSWNAWDRQRMGWYAPGNQFNPSARNSNNTFEVNGDLDASNPNHAGIYTLRDFVKTGDAIRIKLPFINPTNEFQQWIWIENRQGINTNNNPFDQWQYQSSHSHCVIGSVPGLGIYIQIDQDIRESNSYTEVFGGHAGYIRPLPANGFWDRNFPTYTVFNECVSWTSTRPFQRLYSNPFTGGGDQEGYTWNLNKDNFINRLDQLGNWVEEENGNYYENLFYLGHAEHIFTLNGNKKLSISGNPSSVPLMNMVSYNHPLPAAKNVRKIYLNGVSVEMLTQDSNGNIQVQIRFDDVDITNYVRWCADEIVLNYIPTQSGYSLNLKSGNTITLDRGLTATRMSNPITFEGKQVFTSPTYFRVKKDAKINIEPDSEFIVKNGSTLKLETGSKLIVNSNSELVIMEGSHLIVDDCAALSILGFGKLIVENGATLHLSPEASLFFSKGFQNIEIAGGAIIAPGTINPVDVIFPYLAITTEVNISNGQYFMPEILQIEEGGKLTVNNTTLIFSMEESRIQIKNGGELIVKNSLLTSFCQTYWQGIEVWGNSQAHQWPDAQGNLAQGYLELNNAVIENAIDAVSLWKPGDYLSTGGIVIARNSVFRNNKRSVHALPYTNFNPVNNREMDYRASFTRCTFELNENYPAAETFYKHVDLDRVRGVKFTACDFSLSPNAPNVADWNMAIGSYSAGFRVNAICTDNFMPCNEYIPSTFTGFHQGIDANNPFNTTRTFYVNRAKFINNSFGIRTSLINNFTVLNSNFYIGYNEPESDHCATEGKSASGYGIHMTGCTGFAIEENYFTKASGAPPGNYTGIYIAETQAADQVYRNTFNGLTYGNYAVGKNWDNRYTWKGLAYYCNENTGNTVDFVVPDIQGQPDGIQNPQGSPAMPAGNKFSANAQYHFWNWDFNNWIGYYYYAPSQGNTNTVYYPQVVNRVTREEVVGIQNPCLSNYGGGGSGSARDVVMTPEQKQQAEMDYAVSLSDYNNVKTLFDNLKDGGSTTATLNEIATAWPSDIWALRAELLGKSPHLSMEVLKAAADRTDVLPESVIFEIMAANPDELKKEELIKYLEDKDNPLPEYMIDILRQVAMGSSYKTVLLRQMAHYGQLKTRAAHNIIRSLLNDTIADNDELRNWLDNIGGKRADEQIIASYMGEGNFTNALALANMMPALYNYSGNELVEHSYYMDMLNLQISLEQQQRSIFSLDSLEVAKLVNIAENSNGTAGLQAKGILEYAYGYHFYNCIEADESGLKSGKPFNPASLEKLSGIEITVVPNPAKDWAAFNYTLPGNATSGVIVISDALGREVASMPVSGKQGQQIWDTRSVKSGVYFYTLNAGGFSKHGKIVISK